MTFGLSRKKINSVLQAFNSINVARKMSRVFIEDRDLHFGKERFLNIATKYFILKKSYIQCHLVHLLLQTFMSNVMHINTFKNSKKSPYFVILQNCLKIFPQEEDFLSCWRWCLIWLKSNFVTWKAKKSTLMRACLKWYRSTGQQLIFSSFFPATFYTTIS